MSRIGFVLLAGAALGVGLGQSAFAADMAAKAPVYQAPPTVAIHNWTGFYVGSNIGGGWAKTDARSDGGLQAFPINIANGVDPTDWDLKGSGVVGGFHAGFNWQTAPHLLLGIEGDWEAAGIKISQSSPMTSLSILSAAFGGVGTPIPGGVNSISRDVTWLASIRGRVGFTTQNWLIYATGGAAWGGLRLTANEFTGAASAGHLPTSAAGGTFAASTSTTRSGWVVGGGLEYAMTGNWILRGEYLYYSLDGATLTAPFSIPVFGPSPFIYTWNTTHIQTARFGVSYKFGD